MLRGPKPPLVLCLGKNRLNLETQRLAVEPHAAPHLANFNFKAAVNFVDQVLRASNLAGLTKESGFDDSLDALLLCACDVLVVGHCFVCLCLFDVSKIELFFNSPKKNETFLKEKAPRRFGGLHQITLMHLFLLEEREAERGHADPSQNNALPR